MVDPDIFEGDLKRLIHSGIEHRADDGSGRFKPGTHLSEIHIESHLLLAAGEYGDICVDLGLVEAGIALVLVAILALADRRVGFNPVGQQPRALLDRLDVDFIALDAGIKLLELADEIRRVNGSAAGISQSFLCTSAEARRCVLWY
jgi:hypothetical protein